MESPRWERVGGPSRAWFRLGVYLAALAAGFILMGLLQSARQNAHRQAGQGGTPARDGASDGAGERAGGGQESSPPGGG